MRYTLSLENEDGEKVAAWQFEVDATTSAQSFTDQVRLSLTQDSAYLESVFDDQRQ